MNQPKANWIVVYSGGAGGRRFSIPNRSYSQAVEVVENHAQTRLFNTYHVMAQVTAEPIEVLPGL